MQFILFMPSSTFTVLLEPVAMGRDGARDRQNRSPTARWRHRDSKLEYVKGPKAHLHSL